MLLIPIALAIVALVVFAALPRIERALLPRCPAPTGDLSTFLSWTEDPATTMTVSWFSPTLSTNPYVVYMQGDSSGAVVKAKVVDISVSCTEYRYVATLRGLLPGTQYSYQVALDSLRGFPHSFRTALTAGQPFTFLAVADMGTSPNASLTLAAMANQSFDFVLHPGDISYAGANQTNWSRWFTIASPIASGHPYMVVPGNHENGSAQEMRMFRDRFSTPIGNPLDPGRSGLYYSFNYSTAHFLGLKSDFPKQHDTDNHSREVLPSDPNWDPLQITWLQRDLEMAANDTAHPWIIVFFHFPPFTSTNLTANWYTARQVWGGFFDRYHVNLVITGHKHNYERTYPVWSNGTMLPWRNRTLFTDPRAPVYIVNGGGGEPLQPAGPPQVWTAKRNRTHEFLRVSINEDRMDVTALYSANGSVLDRFSLLRPELSPRTAGFEGLGEETDVPPVTPMVVLPGPPSTFLPGGSQGPGAMSAVPQLLMSRRYFLGTPGE